jgi:hypothetical protein
MAVISIPIQLNDDLSLVWISQYLLMNMYMNIYIHNIYI